MNISQKQSSDLSYYSWHAVGGQEQDYWMTDKMLHLLATCSGYKPQLVQGHSTCSTGTQNYLHESIRDSSVILVHQEILLHQLFPCNASWD